MHARLGLPLALLTVLLAAGCGNAASTPRRTQTGSTASKATATTPATTATDTTAGAVDDTCSASRQAVQIADEPGLPAPVDATRRQLLAAAAACDFESLQTLAFRHRDQFAWAQGDAAPAPPATYWKAHDAQQHTMARLVQLLLTPHALSTEGPRTYVWPAVQGGARTAADWRAVVDSGAYSASEVAAMRKDDLYTGYRIGILPDGTWTYFTMGG